MTEFKPTTDISEVSEYKLGELIEANETPKLPSVQPDSKEDKFEEDFNLARDTIVNILENTDGVMQNMLELAKESDSPRAYEVLASMMNNFIASSKELVDLYEKKNKVLSSKEGPSVQNNTQNNNYVFSGSPNELLELLNKQRKDD